MRKNRMRKKNKKSGRRWCKRLLPPPDTEFFIPAFSITKFISNLSISPPLEFKIFSLLILQFHILLRCIITKNSTFCGQMDRNQLTHVLNKVSASCQYLNAVNHISKFQNSEHQPKPEEKVLCPLSCIQVIVQFTYLLYTCSILKLNIYVCRNILYTKKRQTSQFEAKIAFFFEQQQLQDHFFQSYVEKFGFNKYESQNFNRNLITFLLTFIRENKEILSHQNQSMAEVFALSDFFSFLKKKLEPNLLNSNDFPLIKQLENDKFFKKYSILLQLQRSSYFYKIRKNKSMIQVIEKNKANFAQYATKVYETKNYPFLYRKLDQFIYDLVHADLVELDKSSTKDYKPIDEYLIGFVDSEMTQKGLPYNRYEAKFYPSCNQQTSKQEVGLNNAEKLKYILKYSAERLIIQLKCVTQIEAEVEDYDFISIHSNNISFSNCKINFQIFESVNISSILKKTTVKKYLATNLCFYLQKKDEPFIKLLLLLEEVTICTKFLIDSLTKISKFSNPNKIYESQAQLKHYIDLFLSKASYFYKNHC